MPRINSRLIKASTSGALTALGLVATPTFAETLSRSVEVAGAPAEVWARIGPFCAIAEWHPAIASCVSDRKVPPTRTLLTKDGAKFVELQEAHSDHSYSYSFTSSPLPVTLYMSTFSVAASRSGGTVVTWSGRYTPNAGHAKDAGAALAGIYESGLAAIRSTIGQ